MDEHDDDLEPEVEEDAEFETEAFPILDDEDVETEPDEDADDLDIDPDESEL
jgi:hypothetical protein